MRKLFFIPLFFVKLFSFADSTFVGNAVTVGSLTDSSLTSGNCVQAGTAGLLTTTSLPCGSGGSTSPGGSNKDVQFNNSGTFGGDNGFQYDSSVSSVSLQGNLSITENSGGDPFITLNDEGSPGGGFVVNQTGNPAVEWVISGSNWELFATTHTPTTGISPQSRIIIPTNNQKTIFTDPNGNGIVQFDPLMNSSFTIPVYLSTITINKQLTDSSGSSGSLNQVLTKGSGGPIWQTPSSGGGGGSSSLEVFNNFDGTRSSPTLSIGANNAFRGTVSGSTYTFSLNSSSVTLYGPNIPAASISAGSLGSSVLASSFPASGVTAGSYTNTNLTVNAQGMITTASNGSAGGGSPGGSDKQLQFNNNGSLGGEVGSSVTTTGLILYSTNPSNIPLIIKSTISQTADYLDFQNISGSTVAAINSLGNLLLNGTNTLGNVYVGGASDSSDYGGIWVGKSIHDTNSYSFLGQTNLTAFNATTSILFRINGNGKAEISNGLFNIYNGLDFQVLDTASDAYSFQSTPNSSSVQNTMYSVVPGATSLVLKGAASETANLLENKNSSGIVLSSFSASGNLTVSTVDVTVNYLANGSAGTAGQFLQSNGAGVANSWATPAGGSSATDIYNATSTAGFPYGFSASTGIFSSSVTASVLILPETASGIPSIFSNSHKTTGFTLSSTEAGVVKNGVSIWAFNNPTSSSVELDLDVIGINAPAIQDVLSLQGDSSSGSESTSPHTLIQMIHGRIDGTSNRLFYGIRSAPGEDAKFVVAGSSFGTLGYTIDPNANNGLTVNVTTSSINYGNVGIGFSTPTATLQVGGTGISVITTSTQPSTISNGLIVGGHIEVSSSTPVISSCGSTPNGSVVGNDFAGKITIGGGTPTSCTMTFAALWANAPACVIASNTSITSPTVTTTTTAMTLGAGVTFVGDVISYICAGYR